MAYKPHNKRIIRPWSLYAVSLVGVLVFGVLGVARAQSTDVVSDNANTNAPLTVPIPEDVVTTNEIDQLNQQIDDKRKQIDEMKRQTAIYERTLEQKQNQRASLQSELADIDDSVENTQNDLEINKTEIESLQLQIQKVERQITLKEKEIGTNRDTLASLLRQLYESDQVTHLELIVQEPTFSGYFSRVQELHAISGSVEEILTKVIDAKKQLDSNKVELDTNRQQLDDARVKLESAQSMLEQQQEYKTNLLDVTQDSEKKYEQVLQELRTQATSVDSEIGTLIDQVNNRLAQRGESLTPTKPGQLTWPTDTTLGISARFHDPTYPFRRIFEHTAVDIRVPHGTAVTAAADGVVAIARKLDWVRDAKGKIKWPAYNFVTIVHGGSLATVYGHLSTVSVTEGQSVKRGEVIGRSGATPGTAGAGRLTTGPHLHFEVRVDGIPDDPIKYLPEL